MSQYLRSYYLRSCNPPEEMVNGEEVPSWIKALLEAQEASRLRQEETINNLIATLAVSNNSSQNNANPHASNRTSGEAQAPVTGKINAAARPPLLDTTTTYSKFRFWRTTWNDYVTISNIDKLPLNIQKAEFRSCLSEDMRIHIKCAIDVSDDDQSTIEEILDKIQQHLRQKRNIALDRVSFEQREQQVGESFDEFYVAVKQLAEEADLCEHCEEQRIGLKSVPKKRKAVFKTSKCPM